MRQTPPKLVQILSVIDVQIKSLSNAAAAAKLTREFTLDGRIIGDIAEVLAADYFEIELHNTQASRHDGTWGDRGVQIKCRKAASAIDFTSVPDLLLVIRFSTDWKQWEVIYNGPGEVVRRQVALDQSLTVDESGRIRRGNRRGSVRLMLDHLSKTAGDSGIESVPERAQPKGIF